MELGSLNKILVYSANFLALCMNLSSRIGSLICACAAVYWLGVDLQ